MNLRTLIAISLLVISFILVAAPKARINTEQTSETERLFELSEYYAEVSASDIFQCDKMMAVDDLKVEEYRQLQLKKLSDAESRAFLDSNVQRAQLTIAQAKCRCRGRQNCDSIISFDPETAFAPAKPKLPDSKNQ
jgi:hypothetical protein